MRVLIIDDAAKARARQVRDFAEDPANLYRPGISTIVPGNDPRFVCHLVDGFRCVYTITKNHGLTFRHLSISVDGPKWPRPAAAFMIAELFGFQGWDGKTEIPPAGWMIHIDKGDHCIAIGQPLEQKAGA